jgi:hypothetical protein
VLVEEALSGGEAGRPVVADFLSQLPRAVVRLRAPRLQAPALGVLAARRIRSMTLASLGGTYRAADWILERPSRRAEIGTANSAADKVDRG